jgi:hypothetical protein
MGFFRFLLNLVLRYSPLAAVIFGACSGSWVDQSIMVSDLRYRTPGSVPFPKRPPKAQTGRQFLAATARLSKAEREAAILAEFRKGNVPTFCRILIPLNLKMKGKGRKWITGTVWVTPNYLAIGSDFDYVIMPMNFYTATAIARSTGFLLPTPKIVDEIYRQAQVTLNPSPIPPSPLMETNVYYHRHNERITAQLTGLPFAAIIAGHKKDVVISNILNRRPGRIAIYGWHTSPGKPIQPLSTAHYAGYADYSHGIRLVNSVMKYNGKLVSLYDVLSDPERAALVSDEGPLVNLRFMMAGYDLDAMRR